MGLAVEQVPEIPLTVDLMTAAQVMGIGRTEIYVHARANEFQVHLVRIGGLYRASTTDLAGFIRAEETGA